MYYRDDVTKYEAGLLLFLFPCSPHEIQESQFIMDMRDSGFVELHKGKYIVTERGKMAAFTAQNK